MYTKSFPTMFREITPLLSMLIKLVHTQNLGVRGFIVIGFAIIDTQCTLDFFFSGRGGHGRWGVPSHCIKYQHCNTVCFHPIHCRNYTSSFVSSSAWFLLMEEVNQLFWHILAHELYTAVTLPVMAHGNPWIEDWFQKLFICLWKLIQTT